MTKPEVNIDVKVGNTEYRAFVNSKGTYSVTYQKYQGDGIVLGDLEFQTKDPVKALQNILAFDNAWRNSYVVENENKL